MTVVNIVFCTIYRIKGGKKLNKIRERKRKREKKKGVMVTSVALLVTFHAAVPFS